MPDGADDLGMSEAPPGPQPIAGVATASAALVGATEDGPVGSPVPVESLSEFLRVFGAAATPTAHAARMFFANGGQRAWVVRATAPGPAETVAALDALKGEAGIGLLLTPDAAEMEAADAAVLTRAALALAEARGLFHIIDVPKAIATADAAVAWAEEADAPRHRNAAVYFPRLLVPPSSGGGSLAVPPAGAVAGIYARTDLGRGVWKAPAGTEAALRGVTGAALEISAAERERLRAVAINPIAPFPGQGVLVWGARTFQPAASDPEWRYVPVRRLGLFVERSVAEGLAWASSAANDEPLWAAVRLSISSFLHQLFRAGAFPAPRPRDAYYVRCGRDTMSEDDIANGRLVAEIGIAPARPAEFVIIRIGQKTQSPA